MDTGVRILETGAGDAIGNMALDWALLDLRGRGEIPDTIRFYAWREPAVSVGYAQDATRELDRAACRAAGVRIVHRPTGGALVLHGRDLTYSVVAGMPRTSPAERARFDERVGAALIDALARMGIEARRGAEADETCPRNRGACFESVASHEITVAGRKIVGNARRQSNGAILQHGSVALRPADGTLVELMAGLDPARRAARRAALAVRATSVEESTGRVWNYEDVWPRFVDAFGEAFDGSLEGAGPGERERRRAREWEERVRHGEDRRRDRLAGRGARSGGITGAGR